MSAQELEGLYDQVNDALRHRVAALGEDANERDFSTLLTQIRAMRMVAEQLTITTEPERRDKLAAALSRLNGELKR